MLAFPKPTSAKLVFPSTNKLSELAFKCQFGAGDESRTRDLNLGKVALYQLSYSREEQNYSTGNWVSPMLLAHCQVNAS
jgi:hypothetical protein